MTLTTPLLDIASRVPNGSSTSSYVSARRAWPTATVSVQSRLVADGMMSGRVTSCSMIMR
jgi:hypothetical protein